MAKLSLEELRKFRDSESLRLRRRSIHGRNVHVVVCMGTCGIAAGAKIVLNTIVDELEAKGLDNVIVTQEDKQTTVLLGLNGSLIVGWSNLDDPKQFYAFDGECPNCFSPDAIPVKSRQLTLSTSGMASCAVCHRQYNLNTGGNVASGDNGRKLNRYHASCAPDGTVSVIN